MLRINLLPAYIAERKKTRNALILASVVWLAVLGIGLGYQFGMLEPSVAAEEEKATQEQAEADRVTEIGKQAETERAKVAPIKDKVDFVKAVQFANIVRQKIYRNAARYTYRNVEYNQMGVTGDSLSVAGFVKNTDDLGRFYITMFGNPDVTAVSIQGIPSYPNTPQQATFDPNNGGPSPAEAGWFPVQLTATLVKPVVSPTLPASVGGGGAASGGSGFGGSGFGGSGGPLSSSGPPRGYGGPGGGPGAGPGGG